MYVLAILKKNLSQLDRNLEALVQELADKCRVIFDEAAQAVARTAVLEPPWSEAAASSQITELGNSNSSGRVVNSSSLSKLSRLRAAFDEKVGRPCYFPLALAHIAFSRWRKKLFLLCFSIVVCSAVVVYFDFFCCSYYYLDGHAHRVYCDSVGRRGARAGELPRRS